MQKEIEYLYSSRKYILAAVAVFGFSFAFGILISAIYPAVPDKLLDLLKETFGAFTALDPFEMMLEIFKNNVRTSFMALVLGLGFGIIPFVFAAINGAVLGILVEFFFRKQGAFFVIAAILPHGIIELPMVLISVGIGFRLGHAAYLYLTHLKTLYDLSHELKQGIIFYIKIIVPLLLLAAIVESYLTPLFIFGFTQ